MLEKEYLEKLFIEKIEVPAPKSDRCPKCDSEFVFVYIGLWSYLPTQVKCTKCDYKESWYNHVGKLLMSVEKMSKCDVKMSYFAVKYYKNKTEQIPENKITSNIEERKMSEDTQPEQEREKKPRAHEIRKQQLRDFVAKYDDRDLKFIYLDGPENVSITAISKLDRDNDSLMVAFAFCSPRDCFSKVQGKLTAFERLEDAESPFRVTVPWNGNGLLAIIYAYGLLKELPRRLKKYRLRFYQSDLEFV